MTKHTIEFNLPEEAEDLEMAMQGSNINAVAFDFLHRYLRNKMKYEDLTDEQYKVFEQVRDEFVRLLLERTIQL